MARSLGLALALLGLWSAGGRAEPVAPFRDLPARHWAFPEVDWLRRDGALVGWEGAFHGKTPLNRYQAAEVLSRTLRIHYADRDRIDQELVRIQAGIEGRQQGLAGVRKGTAELARRLGMPAFQDLAPASTLAPAPPARPEFREAPGDRPVEPPAPIAETDPDEVRSARIRALREAYAARRAGTSR